MLPAFASPADQAARAWLADGTSLFAGKRRPDLAAIQLALRKFLRSIGETPAQPPLDLTNTLLVVALSGGADSLALAAALAWVGQVAGPNHTAIPLNALVVDHGWRTDSAAEAHAAAQLASELGFSCARVLQLPAHAKLKTRARDGAQTPDPTPVSKAGLGPEGQARQDRWTALAQAAEQLATQLGRANALILTGHTMNDQAETMLLGLARGSGPRSIWGMPALRRYPANQSGGDSPKPGRQAAASPHVWIGKPLLALRRHQTEAACTQAGLLPAHDPTNHPDGSVRTRSNQPLPRAALRHRVLPLLGEVLGQDVVPNLARTAAQLQADLGALDWWARDLLRRATVGFQTAAPGADLVLSTAILADVPNPVLRRTLREAGQEIGWKGAEITSGHLADLTALVNEWRGQGPVDLPGAQAWRQDGYLFFQTR